MTDSNVEFTLDMYEQSKRNWDEYLTKKYSKDFFNKLRKECLDEYNAIHSSCDCSLC